MKNKRRWIVTVAALVLILLLFSGCAGGGASKWKPYLGAWALPGWPAQQLAWMLPAGKGIAGNIVIATAIALACAALSWFLVERPALRLKKRFVARGPEASPVAAQG